MPHSTKTIAVHFLHIYAFKPFYRTPIVRSANGACYENGVCITLHTFTLNTAFF